MPSLINASTLLKQHAMHAMPCHAKRLVPYCSGTAVLCCCEVYSEQCPVTPYMGMHVSLETRCYDLRQHGFVPWHTCTGLTLTLNTALLTGPPFRLPSVAAAHGALRALQ